MVWKPSVTVAAIAEHEGRFLLVEERTRDGIRFNQPAGHLEPDESIIDACAREALEETGYHFEPLQLVGVYRWHYPGGRTTYLRFAFAGRVTGHEPERPLDKGIIRAVWMDEAEVRASAGRHRSPLVLRCIEDYVAGRRYPLELLTHLD